MRLRLERFIFWPTTIGATAVLVLIVGNAILVSGNQTLQGEINARQLTIADAVQRGRNSPLVRELVLAAQKEKNTKIRDLLEKYGIAYAEPSAEPAASAPAAGAQPQASPAPPNEPAAPPKSK
jgi:hypothetical protein